MTKADKMLEYIRMAEKVVIKQYISPSYAGGVGMGYPGKVETVRSIDEVLAVAEKIK